MAEKTKDGNEKKKRKKYIDMTLDELEQEKAKIIAIKKDADNKLVMINGLLLAKKVQATKEQEIADKNAEIERLKKQLQEQAPIQSAQTTPMSTPKTREVQSEQIKSNTPTPTTISSAEAEARKETKEERIKKLGIGLPLK
jgi:hypothetical protein